MWYSLLMLIVLHITSLSVCWAHTKGEATNRRAVIQPVNNSFGEFRVIATNNKRLGVYFLQRLTLADQINVVPKSYVALLHKSGATIEINKAGVYSVKSLKAQLLAYAKTHPQYPINLKIDAPNKRSYKYIYYYHWGHRCPEPTIGVLLPTKSKVWSRKVSFAWYNEHSKDTTNMRYKVTIKNLWGEQVFSQLVTQKHIALTLPNTGAGEDDNLFIINIKPMKGKAPWGCKQSMIEYLNNQELRDTYNQFKLENQKVKSPLVAAFNEIVFWSSRSFTLQADRIWRKLVKQFPTHPVLANAYMHFRVMQGLKRISKKTR